MDAVREALYRAEEDLSVAQELQKIAPRWVSPEGQTIGEIVAARQQRVRELWLDLYGEC